MAIRKNTKRIDPRYFMDEKMEVVKEISKCPAGQTWKAEFEHGKETSRGRCVDLNETKAESKK